jgi:hypothetical protein
MNKKLNMEKIESNRAHVDLYKLCIAGVGFMSDDFQRYNFYSHNGDYIGSAPTYMVQPFTSYLKRNLGIIADKYPMEFGDRCRPLTYGCQNLIEWSIVEKWMNDLSDKPIHL